MDVESMSIANRRTSTPPPLQTDTDLIETPTLEKDPGPSTSGEEQAIRLPTKLSDKPTSVDDNARTFPINSSEKVATSVDNTPQLPTNSSDKVVLENETLHLPTNLKGKVALVTGASRGIGAGIAIELGARKASVIVNYVKGKASADDVVRKIECFGSQAIAVQADVSKVSDITRLFDAAVARYGKIDIVVSNSGTESFDKTEDITEERFDFVFGLNLRAQFFVGQHAYKYCEPGGRLILMSSIAAGLLGVADHALYSGSKSAVNGITKAFATDFGKKGMTCNAIAPGGVKSDMFTQVAWRYIPGADGSWSAGAIEDAMADQCPLKRCALPVDVARVVAFLASEDGGWVNGQIITISGGSGQ